MNVSFGNDEKIRKGNAPAEVQENNFASIAQMFGQIAVSVPVGLSYTIFLSRLEENYANSGTEPIENT